MSRHNKLSFSFSNILSDPFALSTLSISAVGWILALIGSIWSSQNLAKFPVFTWWGLSCQFLILVIVFYVTGLNNVNPYRLGILAGLAMTTVYTTNSTNNFVYLPSPSTAAAAAGYMLLSIINIVWMFYYGTTDDVRLHALIDSFSGNKQSNYASTNINGQLGRMDVNSIGNQQHNPFNEGLHYRGSTNQNGNINNNNNYPHMFMAAPLGAFENSSDNKNNNNASPIKDSSYRESNVSGISSEVPPTPTEYPYRARAVYTFNFFFFFFFFFVF
jgi:SHO1 osmosensor